MVTKAVMLTGAVLGLALSGCVTTHGNLASSADRLERASLAMEEDARDRPRSTDYDSADYSREARELAEQAHDFREAVEERTADSRDVRGSFERLSRRYHDLRDEVERTEGHQVRADMRRVTEAYLDVEREMGGYHERHRYARGDDTPDRDR